MKLGKFRLYLIASASIAVCIVIGAITLASTHAASSAAAAEAEAGTVTGNAETVTDNSASGGSAVMFGNTSVAPAIPTADTVGPRCSTATTITADQALATLRSTGELSCVTIDGQLTLEGSDGINWKITDVKIMGGTLYGLRAYLGFGGVDAFTGTLAQRPVFSHIEVVGIGSQGTGDSCSAAVAAANVIIEYANVYGCIDGIKFWDNATLRYSWVHDMDHPSGAHSDAVQITRGTGIEFTGNRFDGYDGYTSDGSGFPPNNISSSVLQTGNADGDIQATWTNNWFAGGGYTIRPVFAHGETYSLEYSFIDNRWLRYGTSVAIGRTDLPPNTYGPVYGDASTVYEWTNNVWDDTGLPVVD